MGSARKTVTETWLSELEQTRKDLQSCVEMLRTVIAAPGVPLAIRRQAEAQLRDIGVEPHPDTVRSLRD